MQVCAQQFYAFDVVSLIKFLVNGVCCIGGAAHGQKENVFAGSLFERDRYGNTVVSY